MAEEKKETKQKTLEEMTVKALRQLALGIEGIVGVHAMKKEELIEAIKKVKGISDEPGARLASGLIKDLKQRIKKLSAQKEEAQKAKDAARVKILRRRISRLKKKTRRAASA
jgi:hypothetical protein